MSWFNSIRSRMVVIMLLLMMAAMLFIGSYLWISLERFYNETHTRTMEQATFPLQFSAREFLLHDSNLRQIETELLQLKTDPQADQAQLESLQKQQADLGAIMAESQENLNLLVRASAPLESEIHGDSFQLAVLDNDLKPIVKTLGVNLLSQIDQSFLNQAMLSGKGQENRLKYQRNDNTSLDMKVLAFPVAEQAEVLGLIYVESGISTIEGNLNHVRFLVAMATFGSMAIIAVIAYVLAGTITGPISVLNARARELAMGDYSSQIDVQSEDEIGELGRTFNTLTLRLRQTLAQIADEKSKMEAMLNYMTEGVIAIDNSGQIIHINPSAAKMFSLTEESNEKLLDDVLPPEAYDFAWRQALEENETVTKEIISYSQRGNQLVLRSHAAPFATSGEECAGVVIVLMDMTEESKLEEMRRDFVANVSHELRTPLTTVRTYVETLKDGAIEEKNTAVRFLSVIIDETDRMTRLVNDLLFLTRLDSTARGESYYIHCLNDLVRTVGELMTPQFEQKAQNFKVILPQERLEIYADEDKIQQVLLNILANAYTYTPQGGSITFSLSALESGSRITVEDTGIGIPEESMDRIFERFYRVDKARSRDKGGNGLGLAIARQIVESHGGRISLSSEVGVGTKVIIDLPLVEIDQMEQGAE